MAEIVIDEFFLYNVASVGSLSECECGRDWEEITFTISGKRLETSIPSVIYNTIFLITPRSFASSFSSVAFRRIVCKSSTSFVDFGWFVIL